MRTHNPPHDKLGREAADVASRLFFLVCKIFNVSEEDLRSERRRGVVTDARDALTMVLADEVGWSQPRIGRLLCKQPSAIWHGYRRAAAAYRTRPEFFEAVTQLQQEIAR